MSLLRESLTTVLRAVEGPEGLPLAWTLRGYRPAQLRGDVAAGLTVAALTFPLSIGYAAVVGLPPEVGLYASFVPLLAYAVFGSARTIVVGPDASTAALIAATLAPLAVPGDDRVRLAGMLAVLVALVFVAMRVARLGLLADFLSRPILVGFLAGIGITIGFSQVEKILGGPAISDAIGVLARIDWSTVGAGAALEAVAIAIRESGANAWSLAVGGGTVAAIMIGRRTVPRVPVALVAVVVTLAASAALDLAAQGVQVLGPVPQGLPHLRLPTASPTELAALLPGALGVAMISFANTTVTGRSFAARRGERTEANRDLLGLAAADAAAGFTGGYPISSSPSRTTAAEVAGASSQLTGIVAAGALALVLILLTGPLYYLPMPALSGVIFVSMMSLIDLRGMRTIWRLKRSEGAVAVIATAGVVFYGTLVGIGIAVLLAALNVVRRAAWPQIAELARRADGGWQDRERRPDARLVAGVVVVRLTGPLFFANVTALRTRVRELLARRPDATAVVLDLGAAADVDLTAGLAMREMTEDLRRQGRRLVVARPLGRVRDELRAYGLVDLMAATGGTLGSVDEAIRGLGLDPLVTPSPAVVAAASEAEVGAAPGLEALAPIVSRGPSGFAVRVVTAVAAIVLGAALVAFLWSTSGIGDVAEPRPVPDLAGIPLDRAALVARDAGFELADPVLVRDDAWPEGTIVDQDPPAGTLADPGTEVQVQVSTGRALVEVPDVSGLSEARAIARLTAAGLAVRRSGVAYDPDVAAGIVLATDPPALVRVAEGTTVGYTVSAGPAPSP